MDHTLYGLFQNKPRTPQRLLQTKLQTKLELLQNQVWTQKGYFSKKILTKQEILQPDMYPIRIAPNRAQTQKIQSRTNYRPKNIISGSRLYRRSVTSEPGMYVQEKRMLSQCSHLQCSCKMCRAGPQKRRIPCRCLSWDRPCGSRVGISLW